MLLLDYFVNVIHEWNAYSCKSNQVLLSLHHPYLAKLGVPPDVAAKLTNGYHHGHHEARKKDHEDPSNVVDSEGRSPRVLLIVPVANISRILPPLVIHQLNHPFLLQLQNRQRQLVAPRGACKSVF